MIKPLLYVLLGLQQNQAQIQQQQTEALVQLQRQVNELKSAVDQMKSAVQSEMKPVCSAIVQWQTSNLTRVVDAQTPVTVTLLSQVSAPNDGCLPGEVRLTVNFHDENGAFVCSGTTILGQKELIQTNYFEFRPFNLEYFAKWRDAPTWEQSNFHRMICYDYEGIEVREPAGRSATLRLFATVLPKRGGLASAELQLPLPRPGSGRR